MEKVRLGRSGMCNVWSRRRVTAEVRFERTGKRLSGRVRKEAGSDSVEKNRVAGNQRKSPRVKKG